MKRALIYVLLGFGVMLAGAIAAGAWLLGTNDGLRWALARATAASRGALEIEDAMGVLAGEVHLGRLAYRSDGFRIELREAGGRVDLLAALAGRVALAQVRAAALRIDLAENPPSRSTPPVLAFGVQLASADIELVEVRRGGTTFGLRAVHVEQAAIGAGSSVSARATFRLADERFPAAVKAELQGTLENARVSLTAEEGGTTIEARAEISPSASHALQTVWVRAGPIDLARFNASLPSTAFELELSGSSFAADALRGTLAARNTRPGAADKGLAPIASIDARFATADFTALRLEALRIALAGGGRLEGQAHANFDRINALLQASAIDLRALRSDLRRTALRGPLEVSLTRDLQSVDGSLSQEGMNLDAHVVRRGTRVDIRRLRAAAAGGEVRGSGQMELVRGWPFRAELAFSRFDPAAFGDYPRGSISGSASLAGRLEGERDVNARWAIAQSTLNGLPLESRGHASLSKRGVSRAEIESKLGATRASAHGAFGRPGDELVWTLNAPRLAELDPRLEGKVRASGVLSGSWQEPQGRFDAIAEGLRIGNGPRLEMLTARLYGSLARHEAAISLRGRDLDLEADLRGGWGAQGWAGELRSALNRGGYPMRLVAPAALSFSPERFQLGRLEALVGEGKLLVEDLRWAPGALASRGEFRRLPAHWLILALGASARVDGDLALDGEWSIAAAPRIDGSLRLRRAGGDLRILGESPLDLGLGEASIDARFAKSRALVRAQAASRYGSLEASGEIAPAADAEGLAIGPASTLALEGRIAFADVRLLSRALLADGRLEGKLSAELKATGTLGEPLLRGEVRGEALALELPPYGVFLRNGELRASLQGERLQIDSFVIRGGEGQLSASGSLPLRLADGDARLTWTATRFTVLDQPELGLVASGRGEAHFDGKRLALSGDLRADRGRIEVARERLPKLGDDVRVTGGDRPAARRRGPLPVKLDVHLDLGDNLEIRAQGLEGKLIGHLDFATTDEGELRAWGKVQTLNATFFAYGQKLEVDPGILVFDGPVDNPSLQVTAWRRHLAVEAGVQVSGTVRAPRVQVVSQPPVPEGERISWLVLGRPPSDATKADLGMLQVAAGALLARGDAMPLDRRIARAFGLDELTLRGTGEAADRVVAVGKRLSDKLYISYEQGIGTVASNLVKMDYSLSRRWSLRAETGSSSGGGVFYRFSWD
ncbi:MAG TPA: translocation/assembly module TamB domain-containing protein [Burkholderiales bacterium]|nr:translocation/assembly module TamB domain-containing protein [Burkholderiales bacterium]